MVARSAGGREVAGSNPAAPTKKGIVFLRCLFLFLSSFDLPVTDVSGFSLTASHTSAVFLADAAIGCVHTCLVAFIETTDSSCFESGVKSGLKTSARISHRTDAAIDPVSVVSIASSASAMAIPTVTSITTHIIRLL